MNEIIKAMEERRSIRKFKPDMPTKEDLEQIVEAGLYAANGMGKQATITIAVTNKKLRDRLSAINAKIWKTCMWYNIFFVISRWEIFFFYVQFFCGYWSRSDQ